MKHLDNTLNKKMNFSYQKVKHAQMRINIKIFKKNIYVALTG